MPWWALYARLDPSTLILGAELHALTSLPCLATFLSRPLLTDSPTLCRGLLRGGATISCCALQLALHCGCTAIHTAGIRLDGPYAFALPRFTALLALPRPVT